MDQLEYPQRRSSELTVTNTTPGNSDSDTASDQSSAARGYGPALGTPSFGEPGGQHLAAGELSSAAECDVSTSYASVLLNGVQLIRSDLPGPGCEQTTTVSVSPDLNVTGEVGGLGIDCLISVSQDPAPYHEWGASLYVYSTCSTNDTAAKSATILDLGRLHHATAMSHVGHYVKGTPQSMTLRVYMRKRLHYHTPTPAEQQFVAEVKRTLENSWVNRGSGSMGSIALGNKMKETSSLYERVLKEGYNSSWRDFLAAHSKEFAVFHYTEEQIAENRFVPHIKRSEGRVRLAHIPMSEISSRDRIRCNNLRADEQHLIHTLCDILAPGCASRKEVLQKLRGVRSFTNSLFPSQSLLMKYLARHTEEFVWTAEPDQPTRVGLVTSERAPHTA
eukprot:TRINITY_DN4856_c0_g1_i1.p1 TRINITY_DN4856_c0_g1~~TRINITY_DN4856_c0_g1_i1.p1  ORF type:complete len:390 (+),score=143.46 TRINITY_DN4856_c0_g1_i1:131-1300(+)